ncbi:MAG TPA: Lrp/AsnC family transcriptional regulator [Dinghuibacter sp.]|jgi:DNA-binding Lrp family transcriptional regulator|uniref:Lrp/AsnC family transcriptional regulator n=1 Tax=Dinghuibacter sp. TaxID=2024697 RepID=UPI002C261AD3|nr:Lrp/AsnC family transcriptional regulator [Dinghuibacter sp.]HTJ12637.1 Lrp/AsnC family transcriptional regulator [Dinghuibacter sp.]
MLAELDTDDVRILNLLQHDARLTNKEIAAKLGKSVTAIHERIRKLEEARIIEGYVAILNRELVGKNLVAYTTVQLKEHAQPTLECFARDIAQFPEVMECHRLAGPFDYLLKVVTGNMNEYNTFLMKKLSTLPNLGSVQSSFVLSEGRMKTAYSLPLPVSKRK